MGEFAGRKERREMIQLYSQKRGRKRKIMILMIFRASWLILTSYPTVEVLQLFSC